MLKKEVIKSNNVDATLFVGVGGIGSKIMKGVADLCKNDNRENMRFVVLDTDVNDLSNMDKGVHVEAVQTSSTRSIKDYLDFDTDARDHWFPNNRILDSKTVSEGAGQVRAISRLALNASIRQGKIKQLYKAIDELYLKDGSKHQRAIKVIIASTITGGTGSGIVLQAAMMIRDYITTNYPQSSAIIRGFFIMPGVMKTVIKSDVEMAAQERNGYATIKEINAFMMKGSGFFDSVPELKRYKDLALLIPEGEDSFKKLDNLPFDFCFLIERSNSEQKSMRTLEQYIKFTSQCIYEQNIGVLSKSASSQEDNVLKEFINPKKLGRCRFGSAGAAVLRYPYESIRDYIAYSWVEKNIIGSRNLRGLDNESLAENTWLSCDNAYREECIAYEKGNIHDDPREKRGQLYIDKLSSNMGDFGTEIKERNIQRKFEQCPNEISKNINASFQDQINGIVKDHFDKLVGELVLKFRTSDSGVRFEDEETKKKREQNINSLSETIENASNEADQVNLPARYAAIATLDETNDKTNLENIAKNFVEGAFNSEDSIAFNIENNVCSIENLISLNGDAMHPNAIRAILYTLQKKMTEGIKGIRSSEQYKSAVDEVLRGDIVSEEGKTEKRDTSSFQIHTTPFKKEDNLRAACEELARIEDKTLANMANSGKLSTINEKLGEYWNLVDGRTHEIAKLYICEEGKKYVDELVRAYEKFYDSFSEKITSITKKKQAIIDDLKFSKGDCVINLFESKEMLDLVAENQSNDSTTSGRIYTQIYEAAKKNAIATKKMRMTSLITEATQDIFDDVIVEGYRESVESACAENIDLDILHALKYEYEVKKNLELQDPANKDKVDDIIREIGDEDQRNKYITNRINVAKRLALPSLSKNDLLEERMVEGIAYSSQIKEGRGIQLKNFDMLQPKNCTDTISKYELRFFSSTYGLEPNDISMFKYVKPSGHGSLYAKKSGDYFQQYQKYMEEIGPDSRINPIITPHIDRRWNSIAEMPELDMDYQKMLMGHIHEAFLYGFVYKAIKLGPVSKYDENNKVYQLEVDGRKTALITSSGSKCNAIYKVVDSMYIDRKLVKTIHDIADKNRRGAASKPIPFDKSSFKKRINDIKRSEIINIENPQDDIPVSVFEILALYHDTLPTNKKDMSELAVMTSAFMYLIKNEISVCEKDADDTEVKYAECVVEQYKMLCESFKKCESLSNIVSEDTILAIRDDIKAYFNRKGVSFNQAELNKALDC